MNALNILHLSDLHIGNFKYDDPQSLPITIANTLSDSGRLIDVIVVSGDVFDGTSKAIDEDRNFAVTFFETLLDQINRKGLSPVLLTRDDVLFVPGNHDLMRSETETYKKYDAFIDAFGKGSTSPRVHIIDKYNFIYDVPDKKIAILGFNSCRIKLEQIKQKDLAWVNDIDFDKFGGQADAIRDSIRSHKGAEIKWDDHGHIDPVEMDNVFTKLKEIIPSYGDYNLVATFHHHFYPFPEIVKSKPDASVIRNYPTVLDQFQRYGIKVVLHGHKHLAIQRVITDNKYFENPNSVIYVLAAGSIGHKDIYQPSFQWLRVYDKMHQQIAEGERYDFNDEELNHIKSFQLPPKAKDEKTISVSLLDSLYTENPAVFARYNDLTNEFEQLVYDSHIVKVIDIVGNLLTIFNDIKMELRRNSRITYLLLLSLNYRVIFHKNQTHESEKLLKLLEVLKNEIIEVFQSSAYSQGLITFLNSKNNAELESSYSRIIKNVSSDNKRIGAYCSIAIFIADLYLNISTYGEHYFDKEKLKHKINLSLVKESFYNSIPSDSITIEGDIDRRAILLNFKSKNPTVHKIAVLIVKDFEMRLDKFEDSLKEIKLKLYYIIPKVQVDNYDLENFHFDAYIPTLLPLLTGDNLYKSKEVFIRELVQNSIDATLLRKKLFPDEKFDTKINIVLGTEMRSGKRVRFFRIVDNGVGMSKFTVERYFTSIGRSYYVSEEFDELKKDKKIRYNAISNFGIGFLSSFMVCKEIMVKTKHVYPDSDIEGLEIEIPNYDGCFFIRKLQKEEIGTDIVLYEDDRKHFNFKKFEDYINKTLIGLPLDIHISLEKNNNQIGIKAYSFQQMMLEKLKNSNEIIFYIPFSEADSCIKARTWNSLLDCDIDDLEKYGIWLNFTEIMTRGFLTRDLVMCLNQGLFVSTPYVPFDFNREGLSPSLKINYPSSFIQLDVSREKILSLKPGVSMKGFETVIMDQACELVDTSIKLNRKISLKDLTLLEEVIQSSFKQVNLERLNLMTFTLRIEKSSTVLKISLCQIKDIPKEYNYSEVCYLDFGTKLCRDGMEHFFKDLVIIQYSERSSKSNIYRDVKSFLKHIHSAQHLPFYRESFSDFVDDNFASELVIKTKTSTAKYFSKAIKGMEIDIMLSIGHFDKINDLDLDLFCNGILELEMISGGRIKKRDKPDNSNLLETLVLIKCVIFHEILVSEAKDFYRELDVSNFGFSFQ